MSARYSSADIFFQGADITQDIAPYLLSVTYTDNEEDETDDLQIKLQDRDSIWLTSWLNEAIDAAAGTPTAAAAEASTVTATVTAKSGLILRAGKSKSSARLAAAPYGAKVGVTDLTGDWYACTYGGQSGYMWHSYLAVQSSADDTAEEKAGKNPVFCIRAVLHRYHWNTDGADEVLDCGQFELDTVSASGAPAQIAIKASSLPYSSNIRQTKKTKAWEAYYLSGIANEIAESNGMASMYLPDYDPLIARKEQTEESDIEFLSRLAHDAGMSVKATNNMIVIFDQLTYEKLEPVATFKRGDGSYSNYKLNTTQADTQYASCRVCYVNPTGDLIEGIAYVTDYNAKAKNNQQLEIRQKVENAEEARKLAAKLLRLHNKYTKTASLTVPGNPALVAGITVSLADFGAWSGRYMVKQSKHTISGSGYVTQLSLRNVLEGY